SSANFARRAVWKPDPVPISSTLLSSSSSRCSVMFKTSEGWAMVSRCPMENGMTIFASSLCSSIYMLRSRFRQNVMISFFGYFMKDSPAYLCTYPDSGGIIRCEKRYSRFSLDFIDNLPGFREYYPRTGGPCCKITLNSNTIVTINKIKIGGIVPDG